MRSPGLAAVLLLLTSDACSPAWPQPRYAVARSAPATGRFVELCFDRQFWRSERYEAAMTFRWPPGSLTCEVLLKRGAGVERQFCVGYNVDALCNAEETPRSPEYRRFLDEAFEKAPELTVRMWRQGHEDQVFAATVPVLR